MPTRDYPRLSVFDFGEHLLKTEDLDPVYTGLMRTSMSMGMRKRWLLAYWCFYHSGVASLLAQWIGPGYFERMIGFLSTAPRGTERRHFRGDAARRSINYMARRWVEPEAVVNYLISNGDRNFKAVSKRAQEIPMFGPWIAFKAADMLERTFLDVSIDFSECELEMYREPVLGARLVAQLEGWDDDVKLVCDRLLSYFVGEREYSAPPWNDRLVNIQEIETILCKFKAHYNGYYPLYKDTVEIRNSLGGWGSLAEQFGRSLPTVPEEVMMSHVNAS